MGVILLHVLVGTLPVALSFLPSVSASTAAPTPAPHAVEVLEPTVSCDVPQIVFGRGRVEEGIADIFTNALIHIPPCDVERLLELSGSQLAGVGPAITVRQSSPRLETSTWAGFVSAGSTTQVRLRVGAASLVSFSNDASNENEDRNLTFSIRGL